jgi:hypothetical protein
MTRRGAEAKPAWRDVPIEVRREVERILGSRVQRAERVYGGYAPSATFRMRLANGRRAFFKGSYPLPKESAVRWVLDREERVYRRLPDLIRPWAPAFYGGLRGDGWHVLLLEDLGPRTVPPWTAGVARAAARDYAAFHAATLGERLPRWLTRRQHHGFSHFWQSLAASGDLRRTASLARGNVRAAREWLERAQPALSETSGALRRARPPHVLMHFDTRSDNLWVTRGRLRLVDWPFACVGPAEFDAAAFAQSVAAEDGPAPERVLAWYEERLPLRGALVDASVAAIAGYFADRAWRAAPQGLPRLRSIQRRQLKASLAWAARRLDLPPPDWLAGVPD